MTNFNLTPTKENLYRLFDFSGGLNTKDANTVLNISEASDLKNVVFDTRGVFRKRAGLQIELGYPQYASKPVQIYHYVKRSTGETERLVAYEDGTLKGIDEFGEWTIAFHVTALEKKNGTGKLLAGTVPCFFTFQDICYIVTLDGSFRYEGRADAIATTVILNETPTIPKASMAVVKNNRVFYSGDPLNKDYLYFSQLANPESVDMVINDQLYGGETVVGGGGIIRTPSDDVEITGIEVFNDALIILKPDSAYALFGTDPNTSFRLETLNVKAGCVAPRSVQRGNNVLFWLGTDGVYFLNSPSQNVIQANSLSDKINPNPKSHGEKREALSFFYDSKYHLVIGGEMYVLDESIGSWTRYTFAPSCASYDHLEKRAVFAVDNYIKYFNPDLVNDEISPEVYAPIDASYSTPFLNLEEPEVTKRFRWLKLFFRPNEVADSVIDIKIEVDYRDHYKQADSEYIKMVWGESEWGRAHWGVMRDEVNQFIRFGGIGETIRFTFSNNRLDEGLEVHGFTLGYKKRTKIR